MAAVLAASGHDRAAATLFLCEGLLVYLDEPTLTGLLSGLASAAAPGSTLAASLAVHAQGRATPRSWRRPTPAAGPPPPSPGERSCPGTSRSPCVARTGWRVDHELDPADLAEGAPAGRTLLVRPGWLGGRRWGAGSNGAARRGSWRIGTRGWVRPFCHTLVRSFECAFGTRHRAGPGAGRAGHPWPRTGDGLSLLAQARELARFADQVHGELARLIGLIDATGAYAEAGYGSTAAFARHACGRAHARAGELVATGRALRQLEATRTALAAGRVSFDAAHVICRAVSQIGDQTLAAAAEQQMLAAATTGLPGSRTAAEAVGARAGGAPGGTGTGLGSDADMDEGLDCGGARDADGDSGADRQTGEPGDSGSDADGAHPADQGSWVLPGLDPRELRRLGEDLTYRADPDAVEERQRKRFERRYLSFGVTLDNVGTISGACSDALSMEIIRTAAEAFSPPGGGQDRRTSAQRRMDGLTAACQAALDSGTAKSRHGALPHLTILLDAEGGSHGRETRQLSSRRRSARPGWRRTRCQPGAGLDRPRGHAHRPADPHPGLPGRSLPHPLARRATP